MILLGNWQLKRLHQKNHLIGSIESNLASPAKFIDSDDITTEIYDKISMKGQFLAGKNIFLYGRRSSSPEKDGYYMLSVFKADHDGSTYLVSRGWLPQSVKNKFSNTARVEKPIIIQAIALPGEKRSFFVPKNDTKNNIWFTIDLKAAHDILGVDRTDYYLMEIYSGSLPEGVKPLNTSTLAKIRNDHLEYAITWYSLATCLVIIFLIYHRRLTKTGR